MKLYFSPFLPENALPARLAASLQQRHRSCPDFRPPRTVASKKIAPARAIGNVGGPTFPSGNGALSARITVRAVQHGSFLPTIMLVRAHTGGEKMASPASAIAIK